MNIVFWGETHRSGTTANYTAMAGILPHLCPDRKIVCGSLQRERCEDSALFCGMRECAVRRVKRSSF